MLMTANLGIGTMTLNGALKAFGKSLMRHNITNIHIEPTTRCNLDCLMCPRSLTGKRFNDLDYELFLALASALPPETFVHLNGVGEALLHPRFLDMVAVLKAHGHDVGFTTNGMLLSSQVSDRLLDLQTNYVCISLDGATKETLEHIRRGADFELITDNTRYICQAGGPLQERPQFVGIKFVLQIDNFHEVAEMVHLASDLGVQSLEISQVEMFAEKDLEFLPYERSAKRQLYKEVQVKVEEARTLAQKLADRGNRLKVLFIADFGSDSPICCHCPESRMFISIHGKIAPCPLLAHSVPKLDGDSQDDKIFELWVGSLSVDDGLNWWSTKKYDRFRTVLETRKVPPACNGCPLVRF